jgi:hypothetical protein
VKGRQGTFSFAIDNTRCINASVRRINGGIPTVHSDATLADMSGNGANKWTLNNSSSTAWVQGLVSKFDQLTSLSGTVITTDTYTWSQTVPVSGSGPVAFANPYISTKVSVKDPGTGYSASAQTPGSRSVREHDAGDRLPL